jgi:hypothetical protein
MMDMQARSLASTHLHRRLVGSVQNFLAKLYQSGERLYGFALLLPSGNDHTQAAAVTEEGLARTAHALARLTKREIHSEAEWTALRIALRWSGPGDGWYMQCEADVTAIRSWFAAARAAGEWAGAEGQLEQLAMGVLQDLESQGAFGRAEMRANVVLGLWDEAQSDEVFLKWAELLNPAAVVARLRHELAQMHTAPNN